jgi:phage protein D
MALETISTETLNFYAPRFEVEIEGKKLSANISKIIKEVRVEEEKDKASRFSMTVNVEYDLEKGGFKWLDNPLFREGNKVSIKMGYGSNMHTMITGRIYELASGFFSGDAPTLTISGYDVSCHLRRRSPEKTYVNKTYSEIVQDIAGKEFKTVIESTEKFERVIRKNSDISYYEFIKEDLAPKVEYEFRIDRDNKLYFGKPKDDQTEIVTLQWGKDLISFNPRMRLSELVTQVQVRGHNPQDPDSPIVETAPSGSERPQERGRRTGSQIAGEFCPEATKVVTLRRPVSRSQARKIALSILNEASDTLFTGRGECIGIPRIKPLVAIRLEKLGERFSGKYYVVSATHTINDSGYRTGFDVKRNAA